MQVFHTLYGKISAIFLILLLLLGIVLIMVSVKSSMNFVRESDQALNRNLAQELAKEFRPFLTDSLDYGGIEHTIHELMVMNPRVEIYLLDDTGKILAFFAEPQQVKLNYVDLEKVRTFLDQKTTLPILGDDPKHEVRKKHFSAARIKIGKNIDGFLYVILGGQQYDSASDMIKESYIIRTTAITLGVALIFAAFVGLISFALLTKRFNRMTEIVKKFEHGEFDERIAIHSDDEVAQLASAFNQMADTIVANMDELRRNDQLRRELIANVSHDLRSPLASMQGYLETILMKESSLSPEKRSKYFKTILENTSSLTKLVDELFELSKFDAKQTQPNPEPFSLSELTQDVVMKYQPEADSRNVRLNASLPKDLPMVKADIAMIERVLSNLIDNALRYTPADGVVHIDLRRQEDKVHVVVSDTGRGIPKGELPRIFERFYRVEKSRGRNSGGSGLGLAIASKIVELHDNTLSVESELGKGTSFSFEMEVL